MNQSIKNKWVKALRSGEYQQTAGYLRDSVGYCCLGVLQKVITGKEPPKLWQGLTEPWTEWGFEREEINEFARMNDEGVPFEMIAGLIDHAL